MAKGYKTGGRQKGTPNKTGFQARELLSGLLSKYMEKPAKGGLSQMEEDLEALSPSERVKAYSGLLNYVAPKQQSITLEEQAQIEEQALTNWLATAPEDAINAIAEKVLLLQAAHRQSPQA